MSESILHFWFEEIPTEHWFKSDPEFDALLCTRFMKTWQQAAAGELHAWRDTARGRLAEVVVLDQFSRNLHRDSPLAFAQDPMALALSQEAVRSGALAELTPNQRSFLLMPYMHSESASIHALADGLFREHAPAKNHEYELKHKAIIDRFGRYPHRNVLLGRASTPDELAFLALPGSSF